MKIKNILLTGVAALAMASCNDFLEVEAPSSYTEEFVFGQKTEVSRALNGVYAQALVNNLYGNLYQSNFILNSDVDISISSNSAHAHNTYARFDCDAQGGEIYNFWTAAYNLIEYANRFINGAENSALYNKEDAEYMQWIGEAKCLRAMVYHDLVVMFGDVPFTFVPTAVRGTDMIPVVDRQEIQTALIQDLEEAAAYMASTSSVTVERCSKEFAQALAARIALTAAGYSLRPDKTDSRSYGVMQRPDDATRLVFLQKVLDNTEAVINASTHHLTKGGYQDVFVNESNYQLVNDGDPIFEIPFAKMSTGNTGYIQGPTYTANEGVTVGPWGEAKGGQRLNAFYRFLFRDNDMRREFVNGLWYYTVQTKADGTLVDSVVVRNDYSVHNNKWSKLWSSESNALGNITTGSTGINFPYMRYADVLLMYAEAANEMNDGPTDKAKEYLAEVHNRAFINDDAEFLNEAYASQEAFQKAVLDERKWEFAGENSRWRDLVRTNTYAEELVYSFLRYYHVAMDNAGQQSGYEDDIIEHDGKNYIANLPSKVYFHGYNMSEIENDELTLYFLMEQFYGNVMYDDGVTTSIVKRFPNQSLPSLRILNAYAPVNTPPYTSDITNWGFKAASWSSADFYQWGNTDSGTPKDQCKYSFYGFIRCDAGSRIWLIDNGVQRELPLTNPTENLPVVRYILPYPNQIIQRSSGAYKNYYGY
ncbi:MAG: RagB/SusD family nutrient uptake outer membrane protein [Prevotella sp.]|nr:RagB/SusD family nutrient uptake outer membrane protein [Prevotella sp.]